LPRDQAGIGLFFPLFQIFFRFKPAPSPHPRPLEDPGKQTLDSLTFLSCLNLRGFPTSLGDPDIGGPNPTYPFLLNFFHSLERVTPLSLFLALSTGFKPPILARALWHARSGPLSGTPSKFGLIPVSDYSLDPMQRIPLSFPPKMRPPFFLSVLFFIDYPHPQPIAAFQPLRVPAY